MKVHFKDANPKEEDDNSRCEAGERGCFTELKSDRLELFQIQLQSIQQRCV